MGDFSGGPVVKTPCSQCRGMGSIPGWGEIRVPCSTPKKILNTTTFRTSLVIQWFSSVQSLSRVRLFATP